MSVFIVLVRDNIPGYCDNILTIIIVNIDSGC